VLIITDVETEISNVSVVQSIPTMSQLGLVLLAVLLLGTSTVLIRYRFRSEGACGRPKK
jgi:hypothetical protein